MWAVSGAEGELSSKPFLAMPDYQILWPSHVFVARAGRQNDMDRLLYSRQSSDTYSMGIGGIRWAGMSATGHLLTAVVRYGEHSDKKSVLQHSFTTWCILTDFRRFQMVALAKRVHMPFVAK